MIQLLVLYLIGITSATDCPDGWLAFHGSCYLFGSMHFFGNMHFTEAEAYCRQHHNSGLVHVNNREENMFLKGYMADHLKVSIDYWLGMTDELVEGIWRLNDGENTVAPYLDWAPSEPQEAFGSEDCAMFGHSFKFRWADVACTTSRVALCELRVGQQNEVIG